MEQKNENKVFIVEFNMDNVENTIMDSTESNGNWCGHGCLGIICPL